MDAATWVQPQESNPNEGSGQGVMTEQQLNKIEKQWNNADCDDLSLAVNHIFALLTEVRRLNRMVNKAIEKLSEFGCVVDTDPCPANYVEVGCAECVRKCLESEVAK